MTFTPAQLTRRAELYYQLGSMIAAGVPLISALEMAANNAALRGSRKNIAALIQYLHGGLTFTDSMARAHGWMPDFDTALLSAGEQSGRLDVTFKLLATYYSARAAIIRDTLSGLMVTIATLHVFLLVFPINLWTAFALGILHGQYSDCIPFIVEKFVVFGAIYGLVIFFLFACQGNRGERWRAAIESLWQMVPLLRTALKYLALSRLAAALGALVSSGVSIVKSWPLATAACGSPYLNRVVSKWEPELESGATPAELVGRTRYIPEMFANLYHTGEISGKLDDSLGRLQEYYNEEGFRALRLFTKIFNGVLYALLVVLVACFVIKFYMAQINNAVNPGF